MPMTPLDIANMVNGDMSPDVRQTIIQPSEFMSWLIKGATEGPVTWMSKDWTLRGKRGGIIQLLQPNTQILLPQTNDNFSTKVYVGALHTDTPVKTVPTFLLTASIDVFELLQWPEAKIAAKIKEMARADLEAIKNKTLWREIERYFLTGASAGTGKLDGGASSLYDLMTMAPGFTSGRTGGLERGMWELAEPASQTTVRLGLAASVPLRHINCYKRMASVTNDFEDVIADYMEQKKNFSDDDADPELAFWADEDSFRIIKRRSRKFVFQNKEDVNMGTDTFTKSGDERNAYAFTDPETGVGIMKLRHVRRADMPGAMANGALLDFDGGDPFEINYGPLHATKLADFVPEPSVLPQVAPLYSVTPVSFRIVLKNAELFRTGCITGSANA